MNRLGSPKDLLSNTGPIITLYYLKTNNPQFLPKNSRNSICPKGVIFGRMTHFGKSHLNSELLLHFPFTLYSIISDFCLCHSLEIFSLRSTLTSVLLIFVLVMYILFLVLTLLTALVCLKVPFLNFYTSLIIYLFCFYKSMLVSLKLS